MCLCAYFFIYNKKYSLLPELLKLQQLPIFQANLRILKRSFIKSENILFSHQDGFLTMEQWK